MNSSATLPSDITTVSVGIVILFLFGFAARKRIFCPNLAESVDAISHAYNHGHLATAQWIVEYANLRNQDSLNAG